MLTKILVVETRQIPKFTLNLILFKYLIGCYQLKVMFKKFWWGFILQESITISFKCSLCLVFIRSIKKKRSIKFIKTMTLMIKNNIPVNKFYKCSINIQNNWQIRTKPRPRKFFSHQVFQMSLPLEDHIRLT